MKRIVASDSRLPRVNFFDHSYFIVAALLLVIVLLLIFGGCGSVAQEQNAASAAPVARLQSRPTSMDSLLDKAKPAPGDHVMKMELEFAMRNQAEFDQLMNEIQDPHSSRYHKWVTPEEMHTKFGETQAQFEAVARWLQQQGFQITDKEFGTNEDFIRYEGTVAQVDRAFRVHIVEPSFELYVPKEDPAIPAQFAGVIGRINGLNNVGFKSSENN